VLLKEIPTLPFGNERRHDRAHVVYRERGLRENDIRCQTIDAVCNFGRPVELSEYADDLPKRPLTGLRKEEPYCKGSTIPTVKGRRFPRRGRNARSRSAAARGTERIPKRGLVNWDTAGLLPPSPFIAVRNRRDTGCSISS